MSHFLRFDRRLLGLAGLMLALHLASFWTQIRSGLSLDFQKTQETEIAVLPMTNEEWEQFKKKQQIVQTENTGKQETPKDEAFLGEKDNAVERQTVARNVDTFNRAAKGNAQADARPAPQAKATQPKKALKDLKLSDVGFQQMGAPAIERAPASLQKKGIENGDEQSQGLSSTNDYIQDVKLGDFTQLNTVEYKYYGFFHRIRGKLEQFWGKSLKEKADNLYKSGRRLPASDQYTTALVITMNEQGEITKVHVKSSSGVRELDEAAIESFNQAGPFPNPPKGLLVNGQATIEWGFVVKS
mgnify:CR=1 FL=1